MMDGNLTIIGPDTTRYGMEYIVDMVSCVYQIPASEILGPSRARSTVQARFEAIYACRHQGYSLPEIGRHFNRDHTSILNACRRHEERLSQKIAAQ